MALESYQQPRRHIQLDFASACQLVADRSYAAGHHSHLVGAFDDCDAISMGTPSGRFPFPVPDRHHAIFHDRKHGPREVRAMVPVVGGDLCGDDNWYTLNYAPRTSRQGKRRIFRKSSARHIPVTRSTVPLSLPVREY